MIKVQTVIEDGKLVTKNVKMTQAEVQAHQQRQTEMQQTLLSPLEQLQKLITVGQSQMNGEGENPDPLPADIQDQIWDLEALAKNRYERGGNDAIVRLINGFVIDPNRQDVTPEQLAAVDALKTQMLSIFGE